MSALAVHLDGPVTAVRVRWTSLDRETVEWVLPPRNDTLLLGKPHCTGENLPVAQLERGGLLTLTAIQLAGSESTITRPVYVRIDSLFDVLCKVLVSIAFLGELADYLALAIV